MEDDARPEEDCPSPSPDRPREPLSDGDSEVSCFVKWTVFTFNFVIFLGGVLLLVAGIYAQLEKNGKYDLLMKATRFYQDPSWLIIIAAFITIFVVFFGCFGALRENTTLLSIFSFMIGIQVLLQVVAILALYFAKDTIMSGVQKYVESSIVIYRDDEDLQNFIDFAQCCGYSGPDDWKNNPYFGPIGKQYKSAEADGVPFSCCLEQFRYRLNEENVKVLDPSCGHKSRSSNKPPERKIEWTGCKDRAEGWIALHQWFLFVPVGIMIIQMISLCFVRNLKDQIYAQRDKWTV